VKPANDDLLGCARRKSAGCPSWWGCSGRGCHEAAKDAYGCAMVKVDQQRRHEGYIQPMTDGYESDRAGYGRWHWFNKRSNDV
jgi:hypothetical protein